MDTIIDWITSHAEQAHWMIFGCILLAGFNIPFSLDILTIIAAVLAATIVPENVFPLFLSIFLGAYFSAWVAYWLGRLLGSRLSKIRWFAKTMTQERLQKMKTFYDNHGFWTLLLGRFIPFGFRNCLFMTAGISKMSFKKFMLRDAISCFIWSSASFFLFYLLGQNYEVIYNHLKIFNIILFTTVAVTISCVLWYRRKKQKIKTSLVK